MQYIVIMVTRRITKMTGEEKIKELVEKGWNIVKD